MIELTDHEVTLAHLPAALDGLRVMQLTDLHLASQSDVERLRRAVKLTNAAAPHLVVITGDLVNDHGQAWFPIAAEVLAELDAPLGVYACLGNHDHWADAAAMVAALTAVGIPVLANTNVRLADGLHLAAVDDPMGGDADLAAASEGIPDDEAVVLLSHNPIILRQCGSQPWLMLSGHTHGGQLALPGLGPRGTMWVLPWTLGVFLSEAIGCGRHTNRFWAVSTWRYPAGWYQRGQTKLFVSRGIGLAHGMPFRWNCPAELPRITLRAAADGTAPRP